MKVKTTKKAVMSQHYKVISVGYCDLQDLLSHIDPAAYTSGVYGWNANVYSFGGVAIVTGYRPFGKYVDYNIVKAYNDKAKAIKHDYSINYKDQCNMLNNLIDEFIAEV